jgi:hypothetical protein
MQQLLEFGKLIVPGDRALFSILIGFGEKLNLVYENKQ